MTKKIKQISDTDLAEQIRKAAVYAAKHEPTPDRCAVVMLANLCGRLEAAALPQAAIAIRQALGVD